MVSLKQNSTFSNETPIESLLRRWAYWIVLAFGLALPTLEASKGLAAILLFVILIIRAGINGKSFRQQLDRFDFAVISMFVASALSTVANYPSSAHLNGVMEAFGFTVIFLTVRHSKWSVKQIEHLAFAIIVGAVLAICIVMAWHFSKGTPVELPAIHGTIRSSLYLAISIFLALGLIVHSSGRKRIVPIIFSVLMLVGLLSMTSRAVIITSGILFFSGLAVRFRWHGVLVSLAIVSLTAFTFPMVSKSITGGNLLVKANQMAELLKGSVSNNELSRAEYWRATMMYIQQGEHVLFGIGPRNFSSIDTNTLKIEPPLQYLKGQPLAHAHNLFLTKYVEEGLLGLLAILALFGLMAQRLLRNFMSNSMPWSWWGALGALCIPIVNGMVASPWFREYAWLAMLVFAIHLAVDRAEPEFREQTQNT